MISYEAPFYYLSNTYIDITNSFIDITNSNHAYHLIELVTVKQH